MNNVKQPNWRSYKYSDFHGYYIRRPNGGYRVAFFYGDSLIYITIEKDGKKVISRHKQYKFNPRTVRRLQATWNETNFKSLWGLNKKFEEEGRKSIFVAYADFIQKSHRYKKMFGVKSSEYAEHIQNMKHMINNEDKFITCIMRTIKSEGK